MVKIFAVPISMANPCDEEDFKSKAMKFGYVWNSGELSEAMTNKQVNLHGLMLKTIIV